MYTLHKTATRIQLHFYHFSELSGAVFGIRWGILIPVREIISTVIDGKCHGHQKSTDEASSILKIEKAVTIPKNFGVLPRNFSNFGIMMTRLYLMI